MRVDSRVDIACVPPARPPARSGTPTVRVIFLGGGTLEGSM